MIPEPDKVIQVCTALALRAGIFHDEEPSDPPHLTHVASGWRLSLEGVFRGNHPVRSRAKATRQRLPSKSARTAASLMSLRFVAVSRVSRP